MPVGLRPLSYWLYSGKRSCNILHLNSTVCVVSNGPSLVYSRVTALVIISITPSPLFTLTVISAPRARTIGFAGSGLGGTTTGGSTGFGATTSARFWSRKPVATCRRRCIWYGTTRHCYRPWSVFGQCQRRGQLVNFVPILPPLGMFLKYIRG